MMIYTYNFFSLVDCQWNEWGSWESCPVTCGGGIQTRIRSKKVEEQFGGLECAGEDTESQTCGCDPCPGKIQLDMFIFESNRGVIVRLGFDRLFLFYLLVFHLPHHPH